MGDLFTGWLELMGSLVALCYVCAMLFSLVGIPAALIGVLVYNIRKKNGTLKWQIEQRRQNQLPPPQAVPYQMPAQEQGVFDEAYSSQNNSGK